MLGLRSAATRYGRHACSELAAAIAYRILFSLVPFVALMVAVLEAVLGDQARADITEWLLSPFPGTTIQEGVEQELARSGSQLSLAGVIALGTLIWTASGMTRSLRVALTVVWEAESRPDFVHAKLRDIAALGVLAAIVLCVFVASLVAQIAVQAGVAATDALGLAGAEQVIARGAELAVTGAATFGALLIAYRLAAPEHVPLAAAWQSTLAAAVAIDVVLAGYAFYLVHIASFDTIYGPLGAVLAFLALVYLIAALMLFGAELIVVRNG
jgi:membrane protein